MRGPLLTACVLGLWACNAPAQGDGGAGPLDVVAGFSGSPTMNPGLDCLSCHSATATLTCPVPPCRASYRPWTVAGTVYGDPNADAEAGVPNVEILVVDSAGKALTLVSNEVGNFYTAEPLTFPLTSVQVQNERHRMIMNLQPATVVLQGAAGVPIGSCNLCHSQPAGFGAPGRLFVPP